MQFKKLILFILIYGCFDVLAYSAENQKSTVIRCQSKQITSKKIKEIELKVQDDSLFAALTKSEQSSNRQLIINIKVNSVDLGKIRFHVESGFEPGMYKAVGNLNFHETIIVIYDRWSSPALTVRLISSNSNFVGDICSKSNN